MSYIALGAVICEVTKWFIDNNISYALVGGLAVSFRTVERATQDVDITLTTDSDSEAEEIVRGLQNLHYHVHALLEHSISKRIATVRLTSERHQGVLLDLLFASSGIEREIVATAEKIEVLPEIFVDVASLPSLIAMKVLAADEKRRPRDLFDLENLIKDANSNELEEALNLLHIIHQRGFNRGKDLERDFLNYKGRFLS